MAHVDPRSPTLTHGRPRYLKQKIQNNLSGWQPKQKTYVETEHINNNNKINTKHYHFLPRSVSFHGLSAKLQQRISHFCTQRSAPRVAPDLSTTRSYIYNTSKFTADSFHSSEQLTISTEQPIHCPTHVTPSGTLCAKL